MKWFRQTRGDESSPVKTEAPQQERRTPLADVKAAMARGVLSRAAIAQETGLSRVTVDAVLEHLERTGQVQRERLAASCPSSGCSSCSHATSSGDACGPAAPGGERGPVVLTLQAPQRRR
ncbi:FeoC-like transcriptional regulator [Corynebacterium sp. H113]|uniref:FeoC-like transcriptional regulator n=1 Tax=Corynebacterium sp. H113 TaxID=3133419 RepID=UPI003097CDEC